jgi:hypothetical protein
MYFLFFLTKFYPIKKKKKKKENDINGDVLLELDHDILKELKIKSIGERIRILLAVKSLLKSCMGTNIHTKLLYKVCFFFKKKKIYSLSLIIYISIPI